jgi:FlaA1/EpsC-like NDP-sugar epimerase
VAIDVAVAAAAYTLAYELRFDGRIPPTDLHTVRTTIFLLVGCRLAALRLFNVFRASWRHVGVNDLIALLKASVVGTLLFATLQMLWDHPSVPRSVFGIDWLLFVSLAAGVRIAIRCMHEGRFSIHAPTGRRTIVIGAGAAAERFIRESERDPEHRLRVVGMLDDDERARNVLLHGRRVLAPIDQVVRVARDAQAELLVIAIPSASGEQMRRIVRLCGEAGVEYMTVPSLRDLSGDTALVNQLRSVQVEDLLGRAPVHLDLGRVERDLGERTILISGGAGSIGSELARQIAGFAPARLILVDQAESALYFVHLELAAAYPALEIVPIVADITNARRMSAIFARYRPDVVFHAAAYKHVPLCEENVVEAVRNNVMGTLVLAGAAAKNSTRKFVLISTDKAVNPSSIMGTTKRVAEKIVLGWPSFQSSGTDFRAVRFGNVLGSDGSVIPLFKRQLAKGGPITVTHPDVRRFFMSIREAVELVLQASALPDAARRILMLEMGESVRIVDLAEQLIRLSGLRPGKDIAVRYTGLRPGEKLDEQLVAANESHVPTDVAKLRVVDTPIDVREQLEEAVARLLLAARRSRTRDTVRALERLVPEYAPNGRHDKLRLKRRVRDDVPRPTQIAKLADRAVARAEAPFASATSSPSAPPAKRAAAAEQMRHALP